MVLDFSAPPGLPEIDALVQCATNVLHQDIRHALLVIYPKKYSGQTSQATLGAQRRVEDMLMNCQTNFDTEVALHFNVDSMHANDRRNLSGRARLCYSETQSGSGDSNSCPWMNGAGARGKISDIPLMRIREMKRLSQPGAHGDTVEAWNLSPAERTQHKGARAVQRILECLVEGMSLTPTARLDVVELQQVAVPDWMEGCWMAKQEWKSLSDKPSIHYVGFSREVAIAKTLQGHLEATLMSEWWNASPEAGPEEPEDGRPVEKPTLSLASWESDTPCLSEVVLCKFDGDETYGARWSNKVADFRQFIANHIAPLVQRPLTPTISDGSQLAMTGPDFNVEPKPVDLETALLSAVPKADFKMSDVSLDHRLYCLVFVFAL